MPAETIFTIGHSTHEIDVFLNLLNKFTINCLIDVRSTPYSRMTPQFNRPVLAAALKKANILYAHFEKEFGARHTRPDLLDADGKVDFDRVRQTAEFKQGVQRLKDGLEQGYHIALMCSEGEPFDCHRFALITYQLVREGLQVNHILPDGDAIDNQMLEGRLLEKYQKKLPQSNLFETITRDMQLEVAYQLRGKAVAFNSLKAFQSEEESKPDD